MYLNCRDIFFLCLLDVNRSVVICPWYWMGSVPLYKILYTFCNWWKLQCVLGFLVRDFLTSSVSVADYLHSISTSGDQYNPFHLFVADLRLKYCPFIYIWTLFKDEAVICA